MDKNALRQEMKQKRREYKEKQSASIKACNHLINTEEYKKAKCVCVYMSAFGEVDTSYIIFDCLKKGKRILLPVTNIETTTLSLAEFNGEFKKGAYGINEPETVISAGFDEPDFIVVPGICFDKRGNRIGFGKGYYDRLLAETKEFKAGLCYDFQVIETIDSDIHDIKMDAIITENSVLYI